MVPSTAITVSPAPETSYTSRAWAGTDHSPSSVKTVMPSSLRVSSKASIRNSLRSRCARSTRSASLRQRPTTSRNSARLGVSRLAPA
jgi:hypothetical protein